MNKITVVILAKNEEAMIADCIDSVRFCEQILVIDSGSTDRTIDVAEKMGAKILHTTSKSFADIRNEGLEKAKEKWILYIDADERITPELQSEIESVVKDRNNNVSAYTLKRKNFYLGKNEWPHIEKLERLFKKEMLKGWYGDLHETPEVSGEVGELEGFLEHYTHRNLSQMLSKTIVWSDIEAKLRINAQHPQISWWRFPRVMMTAFFDSFIRQQGWRVGVVGLIESMYQAFSMFITYAKVWELQQKTNDEKKHS